MEGGWDGYKHIFGSVTIFIKNTKTFFSPKLNLALEKVKSVLVAACIKQATCIEEACYQILK